MAKLFISGISTENIDFLPQEDDMEDMSDNSALLSDYTNKLERNTDTHNSLVAIEANLIKNYDKMDVALEVYTPILQGISRDLGVPLVIPALEDFSGRFSYKVTRDITLEGIGGFFKEVWRRFVEFIKTIFRAFKGLFTGFEKQNKILMKQHEEFKKQLNSLIKDNPNYVIKAPTEVHTHLLKYISNNGDEILTINEALTILRDKIIATEELVNSINSRYNDHISIMRKEIELINETIDKFNIFLEGYNAADERNELVSESDFNNIVNEFNTNKDKLNLTKFYLDMFKLSTDGIRTEVDIVEYSNTPSRLLHNITICLRVEEIPSDNLYKYAMLKVTLNPNPNTLSYLLSIERLEQLKEIDTVIETLVKLTTDASSLATKLNTITESVTTKLINNPAINIKNRSQITDNMRERVEKEIQRITMDAGKEKVLLIQNLLNPIIAFSEAIKSELFKYEVQCKKHVDIEIAESKKNT